ncbi:lipid IV(A) 3-deoxy-D-manno-octulosonic acid transferase [Sulfurisoma sediminicola]|uniref:3-deoxy-D-manno-octulosonic acid transferase n=1 Tax=Sulfurisoma sediminicola TaxID=1381557 RepID=A0A497XL77_9PROT|nr:lipid IV(A) 3-deoxy-D-manno-octulosonic acid transferase [Sulfurisoma sediminicola]RLJ68016.1 3-deoxy-D-manno-octulosonic-acid transferase [Sulfurisoma sediminicola]
MSRRLYTLALWLLLPWGLLHLLWRARRQPDYLRHWGERFGFHAAAPIAPLIWIHAVSVGETRAAQPLVTELKERYPGHRILLTHMTPTGRQTSEALFGDGVDRIYLPYDYPFAVRRFLDHFRPRIGLIMETELWPNLIAACKARGVPLALVNARLSEKSARGYARFPRLAREALGNLAAISAQGEADAARLSGLGAPRVEVFGNIKFDIAPPADQLAKGEDFRRRIGQRKVFLAASTREGEEALILDAWRQAAADATALLVIVPRHPQRFDEVAALVASRGLRLQRRSDEVAVGADTQVWLGDSMGEMFPYYAAADVAFVGGSLLPYGSQNLIEAAACGTPVLLGPSTYNFAEAARGAIACGAVRQCETAEEIAAAAAGLLENAGESRRMREAGLAFVARHRGATQRTLALIEKLNPAGR